MDSSYEFATEIASNASASLPKAQDFTRHLNQVSKNRLASTLKELYKYQGVPGMVSSASRRFLLTYLDCHGRRWVEIQVECSSCLGIPHPQVFPFETLSATILAHDAFPLDPPRVPKKSKSLLSWLFQSASPTTSFTIPKYVPNPTPTTIQLSTSLQYAAATGPPALPLFLREYVAKVYKPAYADWDVLVNVGNTDGWSKIINLIAEKGDAVLVEEWTYPSAVNSFLPYECEPVAIKMDAEGMSPEHLEEVLGGWDEEKRGKRRPHIMYTVPTGQNPTGATMMDDRKKKLYDICYVIICEDEPYYCLRLAEAEKKEGSDGNAAFIKALPPSYLYFDTEGRVIRMDTSAPGSRLGWITANPQFIERLTRISETSTQAPSGFATALTTTMLEKWGFEGYIRWLRGIKATYNMRKTWICDAFEDTFHLEFDQSKGLFPSGSKTITCYSKQPQSAWDEKKGLHGPGLVTFVPPTVSTCCYNRADVQVLFAPGWYFDGGGEHAIGGPGYGYFRLSFSIATYEETYKAVQTFSQVLDKFFQLK
ncbi:uncharacterized protein IL334_004133 [Kwoniella shivajii]|uniref:Aminotransferase class I/classII large domain-containing protein n=1 Tax=Kwoniella shivajii TaxID=564305 RepID=A0ABZ1D3I8_9TREE|nr:hypothetical protein IL334_004133 [Kwoniella shivajii]